MSVNPCCYSHRKLSSKVSLSKTWRIEICWTVGLLSLCVCVSVCLFDTCFTFREKHKSQMFEEKALRNVSGCNQNEINVLGS